MYPDRKIKKENNEENAMRDRRRHTFLTWTMQYAKDGWIERLTDNLGLNNRLNNKFRTVRGEYVT